MPPKDSSRQRVRQARSDRAQPKPSSQFPLNPLAAPFSPPAPAPAPHGPVRGSDAAGANSLYRVVESSHELGVNARRGRRGRKQPPQQLSEAKEAYEQSLEMQQPHSRGHQQQHQHRKHQQPCHSHPSHPALPLRDASALTQHLIQRLTTNAYECCICNELIGKHAAVWTCHRCYVIVHHSCIGKWFNTKVSQGTVAWPCPGCLTANSHRPPPYQCFCGRVQQPEFNPFITPHSCGQTCNRVRGKLEPTSADSVVITCPHSCLHQCHPGPCAPCLLTVTRRCGCGRHELQFRCGGVFERAALSCQSVCGKPLPCGVHHCQRQCHTGVCGQCDVTVSQRCWCDKHTVQRPCCEAESIDESGEHRYSCQSQCERLLDCGNHTCRERCHSGDCQLCDQLPTEPQHCACGKSARAEWKRQTCEEPLPLCDSRCDRLLRCGRHRCTRQCHEGDCGDCHALVKRACRCGRETVTLSCSAATTHSPLTCNTPCRSPLRCGKHKCDQRCCDPHSEHLCMKVCDRPLDCGRHCCDRFCHGSSPCQPCTIVIRGGVTCACGRTSTGSNVRCGISVQCPHPCHRQRHCGHTCTLPCHLGDCDIQAPCAVLTTKLCAGGHKELRSIPCYVSNASCGVTCKRMLQCAQHYCLRSCHSGACMTGAGDEIASCSQKCGRARRCGHSCKTQCHPGLDCPDMLCDLPVPLRCACGRRSRDVKCCVAQEAEPLECDDACEIAARNARFRDAVGVTNSDIRPVIPFPAPLMDRVLSLNLLDLCARLERRINDWLDDGNTPTKMFNAMPASHRWLLHQLSSYYQLHSESFDSEPNRSVRLQRTSQSSIPLVLLSSATRNYLSTRQSQAEPRTLDSRCLLHFVDLEFAPTITPGDLHAMLHQWSGRFRLNWLDSHAHAFAVFDSITLAGTVLESLTKNGLWRTEPDEGSAYYGQARRPAGVDDCSLCLYRKLRVNEAGQREAAVRERESRRRVVTTADGFTEVSGSGSARRSAINRSISVDSIPSQPKLLPAAVASLKPLKSLKPIDHARSQSQSADEAKQANDNADDSDSRLKPEGSARAADDSDNASLVLALALQAEKEQSLTDESPNTLAPAFSSVSPPPATAASPTRITVGSLNRWAALLEDADAEESDGTLLGKSTNAARSKGVNSADEAIENDWTRAADRRKPHVDSKSRRAAASAW